MTVTRVPASNPEPEGLDGRGTTHAADLPATAHTWGHLSVSLETDTDLDADVPVTRSLCLLVDPEGDYLMPGRCKRPLGHEPPHDWGATHGAFLGEVRRAELTQGGSPPPSGFTQREMEDFSGYVAYAASAELDTPSGRLPVRTPGAALRDEEGSGGPGGPGESARPGESILGRRVIERWPAGRPSRSSSWRGWPSERRERERPTRHRGARGEILAGTSGPEPTTTPRTGRRSTSMAASTPTNGRRPSTSLGWPILTACWLSARPCGRSWSDSLRRSGSVKRMPRSTPRRVAVDWPIRSRSPRSVPMDGSCAVDVKPCVTWLMCSRASGLTTLTFARSGDEPSGTAAGAGGHRDRGHHSDAGCAGAHRGGDWGAGEVGERGGEAMSEDEGMLVARITIERRMTGGDIVDYVTTEDVNGEDLPVSEALGMMRMAEHTLLTPEDEGDDW